MLSKWDATWHARMLPGGRAHPRGIEAPRWKCQAIEPVLFQLCQTSSLSPRDPRLAQACNEQARVRTPRRNASPARTVRACVARRPNPQKSPGLLREN